MGVTAFAWCRFLGECRQQNKRRRAQLAEMTSLCVWNWAKEAPSDSCFGFYGRATRRQASDSRPLPSAIFLDQQQIGRSDEALDDDIVACAAVEDVLPGAAKQHIVAGLAVESVVAVAADQDIVAVRRRWP